MNKIEPYQDQFPVIENLIHLNHAAVGPWPKCAGDAVQDFMRQNVDYGSRNYPQWMEVENRLHANLARLINAASADEIALVKNTSEGLSLVAYGLNWNKGDNVVGILQEFPSNRFVWDSLADQGVEFRKLDMEACDDPEQALMALCDEHTRLISISAVQYASGYRMDLARIGDFCRERGILFCVDAIQQVGALPFDVQAIQADFAIADGHKWMLSAEGLGFFYVRAEVMDQLKVLQYGWHMVDGLKDYSDQTFSIDPTARRFECGTPNMLGIHAFNASVELLLEVGMQNIGARVLENTRFLIEKLSAIDRLQLRTDTAESRLSGIVSFSLEGIEDKQLYLVLSEQKILCALRGGIRLSPHFYTPREQLQFAVDQIRKRSR